VEEFHLETDINRNSDDDGSDGERRRKKKKRSSLGSILSSATISLEEDENDSIKSEGMGGRMNMSLFPPDHNFDESSNPFLIYPLESLIFQKSEPDSESNVFNQTFNDGSSKNEEILDKINHMLDEWISTIDMEEEDGGDNEESQRSARKKKKRIKKLMISTILSNLFGASWKTKKASKNDPIVDWIWSLLSNFEFSDTYQHVKKVDIFTSSEEEEDDDDQNEANGSTTSPSPPLYMYSLIVFLALFISFYRLINSPTIKKQFRGKKAGFIPISQLFDQLIDSSSSTSNNSFYQISQIDSPTSKRTSLLIFEEFLKRYGSFKVKSVYQQQSRKSSSSSQIDSKFHYSSPSKSSKRIIKYKLQELKPSKDIPMLYALILINLMLSNYVRRDEMDDGLDDEEDFQLEIQLPLLISLLKISQSNFKFLEIARNLGCKSVAMRKDEYEESETESDENEEGRGKKFKKGYKKARMKLVLKGPISIGKTNSIQIESK